MDIGFQMVSQILLELLRGLPGEEVLQLEAVEMPTGVVHIRNIAGECSEEVKARLRLCSDPIASS